MNRIITASYCSPIGEIILGTYGDALCLCVFRSNNYFKRVEKSLLRRGYAVAAPEDYNGTQEGNDVISLATKQLDEYFSGVRSLFSLPLHFFGTPFQQKVWNALAKIPYGTTTTYRAVSERIGNARATRAVAAAIGANSLAVILPCHRVIGSDGSLTGYAGGLLVKRVLLHMEGIDL